MNGSISSHGNILGQIATKAALTGHLHSAGVLADISLGKVQINRIDGARVYTDSTENWDNSLGFIPEQGEIIVYTDRDRINIGGEEFLIPGVKIGTGVNYLSDIPFIDAATIQALSDHINDQTVHISQNERNFWNNKLNISEVIDECLIINRN